MEIRYSTGPNDIKRYTSEELRKEFLISGLYKADEVVSVYSHADRVMVLGIMPVKEAVHNEKGIDVWGNFGTTSKSPINPSALICSKHVSSA